jgi:hypothetical protein
MTTPAKKRRGRPQLGHERRDAANTVSMTVADRAKLEAAMHLVPGGESSLTNFIRRGAIFGADHLHADQQKMDDDTVTVAQIAQMVSALVAQVQELREDNQNLQTEMAVLTEAVSETETIPRKGGASV